MHDCCKRFLEKEIWNLRHYGIHEVEASNEWILMKKCYEKRRKVNGIDCEENSDIDNDGDEDGDNWFWGWRW